MLPSHMPCSMLQGSGKHAAVDVVSWPQCVRCGEVSQGSRDFLRRCKLGFGMAHCASISELAGPCLQAAG